MPVTFTEYNLRTAFGKPATSAPKHIATQSLELFGTACRFRYGWSSLRRA
jgi:hypothetical protein